MTTAPSPREQYALQEEFIHAHARCESGGITFQSCGREWRLLRPADLESLWDSITDDAFAEDERLPYWVELWPSTLALALLLTKNKENIAGKICLDIGCGLGFTALLASSLGARVIGMDYEPEALVYAAKNAAINNVPQPLWTVMDWRFPAVAKGSCDFIWGGDIMYEKRFVRPVFDFLNHCLAPQGRVWFAEPGRGPYEHFSGLLAQNGWISKRVSRNKVESLHIQSVPVTANLWELRRL